MNELKQKAVLDCKTITSIAQKTRYYLYYNNRAFLLKHYQAQVVFLYVFCFHIFYIAINNECVLECLNQLSVHQNNSQTHINAINPPGFVILHNKLKNNRDMLCVIHTMYLTAYVYSLC